MSPYRDQLRAPSTCRGCPHAKGEGLGLERLSDGADALCQHPKRPRGWLFVTFASPPPDDCQRRGEETPR